MSRFASTAMAAALVLAGLSTVANLHASSGAPRSSGAGDQHGGASPQHGAAKAQHRVDQDQAESHAAAARQLPRARHDAPATDQSHGTQRGGASHGAGGGQRSAAHWGYTGEYGPSRWAEVKPEFETCAAGKEQSPIDIKTSEVERANLTPIEFDYLSSPLKILDNGHTIQVNYAPGSFITVAGEQYQLLQFHFHRPSEERVNGKSYEMVAHFVHKNSAGKLAVVGVLLQRGRENELISTLWRNLPSEIGRELAVPADIDAAQLLPDNQAYFNFAGSLTTPPCSEGVNWFVLKTPVDVSAAQVARFAKSYRLNSRPVQALNQRVVRESM